MLSLVLKKRINIYFFVLIIYFFVHQGLFHYLKHSRQKVNCYKLVIYKNYYCGSEHKPVRKWHCLYFNIKKES